MCTLIRDSEFHDIRSSERNQLVTVCHFVSMFAMARCGFRKSLSINELHRGRQYQPGAQGYKKSQSQTTKGLRQLGVGSADGGVSGEQGGCRGSFGRSVAPCRVTEPGSKGSNDLLDRLRPLHADQLLIQPAVEIGECIRIEAHLVQNRGMQVFHVEAVADAGAAEFVG